MLDNMTTGEKVIAGATAIGIAALVFHKPTRNAVGLNDGGNFRESILKEYMMDYYATTRPEKNGDDYEVESRLPNGRKFKTKTPLEEGKSVALAEHRRLYKQKVLSSAAMKSIVVKEVNKYKK